MMRLTLLSYHLVAVLLAGLCLSLSGCGGSSGSVQGGSLYGQNGSLSGPGAPTGSFGPVGPGTGEPRPFLPGDSPSVDAPTAYLHVATQTYVPGELVDPTGLIRTFGLFSDGRISDLGSVPTTTRVLELTSTPDGRYLYATGGLVGAIDGYVRSSQTGVPSANGSPQALPSPAGEALVEGTGRYLYVREFLGTESLTTHAIGPDGRLTSVGAPYPIASSSNGLYMGPNADRVYTLGPFASSPITVLGIDPSSGALSTLSTATTMPDNFVTDLCFSNDGAFAFLAGFNADEIISYLVDPSSGELSRVTPSVHALDFNPAALAAHPELSILYAVATENGARRLLTYSIGGSGVLTAMGAGLPLPADTGSYRGLLVTPDGAHAYLVGPGTLLPISLNSDGAPTLGTVVNVPNLQSPQRSVLVPAL